MDRVGKGLIGNIKLIFVLTFCMPLVKVAINRYLLLTSKNCHRKHYNKLKTISNYY